MSIVLRLCNKIGLSEKVLGVGMGDVFISIYLFLFVVFFFIRFLDSSLDCFFPHVIENYIFSYESALV